MQVNTKSATKELQLKNLDEHNHNRIVLNQTQANASRTNKNVTYITYADILHCFSDGVVIMDKNISPVGWYVGTYLARFIEIEDEQNADPEARFATWENTVIVKTLTLDEAFEKVEKIGIEHAEPYKNAEAEVLVQWEYLGIIELLPIYEELEDGSEIMWASKKPKKLKNLKAMVFKNASACKQ